MAPWRFSPPRILVPPWVNSLGTSWTPLTPSFAELPQNRYRISHPLFFHPLQLAFLSQAGIFSGLNPATYNVNDPFVLWVIQTGAPSAIIPYHVQSLNAFTSPVIIVGFTQLLS